MLHNPLRLIFGSVVAAMQKLPRIRTPDIHPSVIGYTGVPDSHWSSHLRGNGSARVRRAAQKARNVRRNKLAHRGKKR